MVRRKLNVDILVCGNRRKEGVVEHEGECISSYNVVILGFCMHLCLMWIRFLMNVPLCVYSFYRRSLHFPCELFM